ncbi:hypothetical protein FQZ97_1169700 [compost metagenome]
MDVHDVADHKRPTLVTTQNARREGPFDLQILHVVLGDLIEFGIAMIGIIAGRHRPVLRVGRKGRELFIGQRISG